MLVKRLLIFTLSLGLAGAAVPLKLATAAPRGTSLHQALLEMRQKWLQAPAGGATLTIYPLHSPFGIVDTDADGRVTAFAEKPRLPYWINIGYLLCEREAFAAMRRGTDMDEFLSALARTGRLHAYRHSGKHLTVNTEKERTLAEEQIVEFLTVMDA